MIKCPATLEELTEDVIKAKETATYAYARILADKGLVDELIDLQKMILPLYVDFPKSKSARITRALFDITMAIDTVYQGPGHFTKLTDLCKHIIDWCHKESRSFLRMRVETNLANLLFKLERYNDALEILKNLTYELKKKEDKQLLVES